MSAGTPWRQFLCRVCGLVYDEAQGDADSGLAPGTRWEDIPDDWACPICGVGKADFEPMPPSAAGAAARPALACTARADAAVPVAAARQPGIVVVGAGRAGWQLVQALREAGCNQPITLVAACAGDVYDKPLLSVARAKGLARGPNLAALVREPAAEAARRWQVRLLADTHAVAIDACARRLRTTRGTLRWSALVLAHGAAPALPAALPAERVWRINDLAAYRRLHTALGDAPRRLVIVGAGLVGCELANDLALAGHAITLLDSQPRPLAGLLPPAAAQRLLAAWAGLPIDFLGGVVVRGVQPAPGTGTGTGTGAGPDASARWQVALADGRALPADQVIAATGLRTPGRLAASAGLAFDAAAGGIVVDAATGRTSVPGIHALGDCVVVAGRASRFIAPIAQQAAAIAADLTGRRRPPPASDAPQVLRVKTSSCPVTLTRHAPATDDGHWRMLADQPGRLHLAEHDAAGRLLAELVVGAGPGPAQGSSASA